MCCHIRTHINTEKEITLMKNGVAVVGFLLVAIGILVLYSKPQEPYASTATGNIITHRCINTCQEELNKRNTIYAYDSGSGSQALCELTVTACSYTTTNAYATPCTKGCGECEIVYGRVNQYGVRYSVHIPRACDSSPI